jgi:hypothetical protein
MSPADPTDMAAYERKLAESTVGGQRDNGRADANRALDSSGG